MWVTSTLVKEGFKGVFCVACQSMSLIDYARCAYLQMQDALYMNRHKIEGAELAGTALYY